MNLFLLPLIFGRWMSYLDRFDKQEVQLLNPMLSLRNQDLAICPRIIAMSYTWPMAMGLQFQYDVCLLKFWVGVSKLSLKTLFSSHSVQHEHDNADEVAK